jgi:hypothetical protein
MVMAQGAVRTTLDAAKTNKQEVMAHCLETDTMEMQNG